MFVHQASQIIGISRNGRLSIKIGLNRGQRIRELLTALESPPTFLHYCTTIAQFTVFVEKESNDGYYYSNTKGDGLCSLRSARRAISNHQMDSGSLPPDFSLSNDAERQMFLQEVKDRYSNIQVLDTRQELFVQVVIHRLQEGIIGNLSNEDGIWPTDAFLEKWIPRHIPWAFYSSPDDETAWDQLQCFYNTGNEGSYFYFSLDDISNCFSLVKSRIKHGGNHFYNLPDANISDDDIQEAASDIAQKLLHTASTILDQML